MNTMSYTTIYGTTINVVQYSWVTRLMNNDGVVLEPSITNVRVCNDELHYTVLPTNQRKAVRLMVGARPMIKL